MKPTEKVVSYQQVVINVPKNRDKLPTYPGTQDFAFFFEFRFLEELLKFTNPQTTLLVEIEAN